MLVRHGLTTWNEQKKIQVPTICAFCLPSPVDNIFPDQASNAGYLMPADTIWAFPANYIAALS